MRKIVIAGGIPGNVEFICGPQHENLVPNPSTSVKEVAKVLQEMLDIQCSHGNWDYDPYMHGMANGMIFSLSLLTDESPEFLNAPKVWGKDKPDLGSPVAVEESSNSPYITYKSILNKYHSLSASDKDLIDTMGKAYNVFKKFGITGFKTPKLSGGVGGQTVKCCTIKTTSNNVFWIRLSSKGDKIQYQLSKPGEENYSSIKLTRLTTDIDKFIGSLLKIRGLSDYHTKMEEYLAEKGE